MRANNPALTALRHHVTGAVERGESAAVTCFETPAGLMRRKYPAVSFADVQRAALFECNGNIWRKVSTRTAVMHWPAGPERAFYFSTKDKCYAERLPQA